MAEPDTQSAPSTPGNLQRRGGSKWIGRAFILLWIVGVVAVYVVIVKLKMGGERALRLPESSETAPAERPDQP